MRQTLYFAVYVNIDGKSPQRAMDDVKQIQKMLGVDEPKPAGVGQYEEKYFVLPAKGRPTGIELLYPTPFLTDDQAQELYEKYYANFEKVVNQIKDL